MKRFIPILSLALASVAFATNTPNAPVPYNPNTKVLGDSITIGSGQTLTVAAGGNITIAGGASNGFGGNWGSITGTLSAQTDLAAAFSGKVDKISGKILSTEDYTTAEKTKLASLVVGGSTWGGITGTLSSQADLAAALGAKLAASNNLSDLTDPVTARANLGLAPDNSTIVNTGGVLQAGPVISKVLYQGVSGDGETIASGKNSVALTGTLTTPITTTLPAASSLSAGSRLYLWDKAGSVTGANTWTLTRGGSDTINTAGTSLVLTTAYCSLVLASDATSNWTVLTAANASPATVADAQVSNTLTVDWAAGPTHTATLAANVTSVVFHGLSDGASLNFALTNTSGNYTIDWGNGIHWPASTQPTQTTGTSTDLWTFRDVNNVLFGSVIQNYSSLSTYTPATDASVIEWLKADAITGLSNGANVTSWSASIGNNATTSSSYPVFVSSAQNSLPAVSFAAGHSLLHTTSFGTLAQPVVIWVVFKPTAFANFQNIFDGLSATNRAIFCTDGSSNLEIYAGTLLTSSVSVGPSAWKIAKVVLNGSSSSFQINNGTTVTGNAGTDHFIGITLGNAWDGNNSAGMTIGEIFVQSGLPSNSTIIWNYLNQKWAIY